jgi:hypothetical protein
MRSGKADSLPAQKGRSPTLLTYARTGVIGLPNSVPARGGSRTSAREAVKTSVLSREGVDVLLARAEVAVEGAFEVWLGA